MSLAVRRNTAGRSAARKHKQLMKAWRERVLGRRTGLLVWSALLLAGLLLQHVHLDETWALVAGGWLGGAAVAWVLLPETIAPGWIGNWQRGAWGEENTAVELRQLERGGWTVRHDIASSNGRWNRDHVVAGPAVYVLDTKNLGDRIVTVEGTKLRATAIEDPDTSYLIDRFPVVAQAHELARKAHGDLGFRVKVYPVIVVWGHFDEQQAWLGEIAVVHGNRVADWLAERPVDLLRSDKRQAVSNWVATLPRLS